uniref:Uncharacterized protein n=1 Tax=Anguilla anguilla TaxID=7936 RepID=A0A0E9QII1_ANGAN
MEPVSRSCLQFLHISIVRMLSTCTEPQSSS